MNKTKKLHTSLIVVLLACGSLISCGKKKESEPMIEVFASSCLNKYEQRHQFSENEKLTELTLNAASNEYEPGQIIINALEDVKSYDLVVNDFVSDKGRIDKKNIKAYSAYYNSITMSQNGYPSGYIPDILIPLEKRIAFGDNVVLKGENQSIWFNVYVPKNTTAGVYKSTFVLKANGTEFEIPITLNVYDFELEDATHVKSAMGIWGPSYGNDMLTNMFGSTKVRTAEKAYYEFLLKYRIAPTSIPAVDLSSLDSYVDQVVEYAARVDVPSFTLSYRKKNHDTWGSWFDETFMHDLLARLVDESTDDFNIFEKVYFYGIVDEPEYTHQEAKANAFSTSIKNIVNNVINEKESAHAFDTKPEVKKSLQKFEALITLGEFNDTLKTALGPDVLAYCFKFSLFDTKEMRDEFESLKENGVGIWAYGCNVPGWPYPTYQVDDSLTSPRSIGVLQMRYGIEGNLFWCSNLSKIFNGSNYTDNWDPYKTAYCFAQWPGDGYLVVPAGKYDSKTTSPFPTMRLEMIREGQEDYEYLYLLKKLAKQKGDSTLNNVLENLEIEYEKVLTGSKPTDDNGAMLSFKEKIAQMILINK